jgi:hypothetical protein
MPRGQYERKKQEVAAEEQPLENVPQETIAKPVAKNVRKFSDEKDHKGAGEPLCMNPKCGHRQDMHYIERRHTEQRVGKNFLGETIGYDVMHRSKDYSGARPCNHACLCTEFE